jgi:hypothetical protein
MYLLQSVSGIKQTLQRYIREDDLLGQALLREGKALWELLRCPRVHAGLPHPTPQVVFEQISGEFTVPVWLAVVVWYSRRCVKGEVVSNAV